jgi:hypothetical protein
VKKLSVILIVLTFFGLSSSGQEGITKKETKRQKKSYLLPGKPWTVEIPFWIPGFAGSFAYGDVSLEGEDGTEIENPIEPPPKPGIGDIFKRIFTTNWYLKFFFMTRVAYEPDKFIAQFDAIAGAVGESTEFNYNRQQVVQANFQTINLRFLGGYKFVNVYSRSKKFRYELFGYIGFRTHFHKIYSDLDGLVNKLDINPVWVEPIIGIQNQFTWKRWFIILQGDYGGYFIPDKQSIQLTGFIYYRSGKITSLKLGWNHLSLDQSGTFLREDYKLKVNLSGPTVGIALHF